MDGTFGNVAKEFGKFLLDEVPLHLLVLRGVNDVVALRCRVLLVDMALLAIPSGSRIANHACLVLKGWSASIVAEVLVSLTIASLP